MFKAIEKYDYVTIIGEEPHYFVSEINEDNATIIGMKLNETRDSIGFYSKQVKLNELCYLEDYFINLKGPLAIVRETVKNGNNGFYIEKL